MNLPQENVNLESDVKFDWYGGHRLQPEDRIVPLSLGTETGLELVELALVSKEEVRPRHEHGGLLLTLSHVLQTKYHKKFRGVIFFSVPISLPELQWGDCCCSSGCGCTRWCWRS